VTDWESIAQTIRETPAALDRARRHPERYRGELKRLQTALGLKAQVVQAMAKSTLIRNELHERELREEILTRHQVSLLDLQRQVDEAKVRGDSVAAALAQTQLEQATANRDAEIARVLGEQRLRRQEEEAKLLALRDDSLAQLANLKKECEDLLAGAEVTLDEVLPVSPPQPAVVLTFGQWYQSWWVCRNLDGFPQPFNTALQVALWTFGLGFVWLPLLFFAGQNESCPACGTHWTRRKLGQKVLAQDRQRGTVTREDKHYSSDGQFKGVTFRNEQVIITTQKIRIDYCCTACQHQWSEVAVQQAAD